MLDIAFINARIVDGTGTPWQRGCVGVHDGRIVQVGSNGDLPEAANIIDVDDHVLCPGESRVVRKNHAGGHHGKRGARQSVSGSHQR